MRWQCILNALTMHCNALIMVFNAFVMLFVSLWKRWKCSMKIRMDEKCFSTRWQLFPTFDPNAAKTLKRKDNVSPWCNKAQHIVNTTNSTLFTSNIILNINILHLREFDFVWLMKRYFICPNLQWNVCKATAKCNPPEIQT